MKNKAEGMLSENIHIIGGPNYPAYLITASQLNVLIDTGINLFGPQYLEAIEDILGSPDKLDYIFITHSHYDHIGSLSYLKRKIPSVKIAFHGHIEALLQKGSVKMRMGFLSDILRETYKDIAGDDVYIDAVNCDDVLHEGFSLDMGDMTLEVIEVPGHTRDSLAFYIPEKKILFPGDSAGLPAGPTLDHIKVEFLSSFDDYVLSLEKMMALNPAIIAFSHGWFFTENSVNEFLKASYRATFTYKELIESNLQEVNGDADVVIQLMRDREFDEKGKPFKEKNAFTINLSAQIKHIAKNLYDKKIFI